jgi:riboflavin kinase/FMN adenylyltransferase
MERLDGGSAVPTHLRGGIVALGNFDGFHRGHQAVVSRAVELGQVQKRPVLVATFDPHPARLFHPDTAPFRLTTLDQRQRLFAAAGADAMLIFHFDKQLAAVSAEDFVHDYLHDRVGAAGVVTGQDFTFGRGRRGNVELLQELGLANGVTVDAVPPVLFDGAPVSSSRIRAALVDGDCAAATRLMTRPFAIEGLVEHGDKRGRELGFATANLTLGKYLRPRFGVYGIRGHLADGRILDGAANVGIRPQFEPPKELLEAHFFDFDGDLYGQCLEVELIAWIRPEAKFASLDALSRQIELDCSEARRLLAEAGTVAARRI